MKRSVRILLFLFDCASGALAAKAVVAFYSGDSVSALFYIELGIFLQVMTLQGRWD